MLFITDWSFFFFLSSSEHQRWIFSNYENVCQKLWRRFTLGLTLKKEGGIKCHCICVVISRGDGCSWRPRTAARWSSNHGARSHEGSVSTDAGSPPLIIRGMISCDHVVPERRKADSLWYHSLIVNVIMDETVGWFSYLIHAKKKKRKKKGRTNDSLSFWLL